MDQEDTSSKAEPAARQATCPSGRCREGAILLGIVGADGVLGYVTPKMTVDADFVDRAYQGRTPETRFRFAESCIEHKCTQWTGDRCGVIYRALRSPDGTRIALEPPS